MFKQLEAQAEALERLPPRADAWLDEPTGQTYRDRGSHRPTEARRPCSWRRCPPRSTPILATVTVTPEYDAGVAPTMDVTLSGYRA